MEDKYIYGISLILLVLILTGITLYNHYTPVPVSNPSSGSSAPSVPRTYTPPAKEQVITASPEDYDRFEEIMPQTDLVKDIPIGAEIQMSFFNFNTGAREWERDYIITRGSIKQGIPSNPDIKLILHSRNLPKLNANNVCEVFQKAKTQGDFGSELMLSKAKLTWKYKSMMGYKSCLGF